MDDYKISWKLEGMTCASCASRVERHLQKAGLQNIWVDFPNGLVEFDQDANLNIDIDTIKNGLVDIGYRVISAKSSERWKFNLNTKLLVSVLFSLPIVLSHMSHTAGLPFPALTPIIQFILSIPVMLICWVHFGKSSWNVIKVRSTNMDVLIFLGSNAAFAYSVYGLLTENPDMLFFEAATLIVTLVLFGNFLERKALISANKALSEISKVQQVQATIIEPDGNTRSIPSDKLEVGQSVLLSEGSFIPADGILKDGHLFVDESLLTGESRAIEKIEGSEMIAGSIVSGGNASMLVRAAGKASYLSRLERMVKMAQAHKPSLHKLSDRVSKVFIPIILGISLLTGVWWWFDNGVSEREAVLRAVAVLVIACPCALGLAVPTAIRVGTGWAARRRVIFRTADVFEVLPKVKRFFLDKTGTLTEGKFDIEIAHKQNLRQWLPIILSLELRSSHPIARSIVTFIQVNYPQIIPERLKDIREQKGVGMIGFTPEGSEIILRGGLSKDGNKNIILMYEGSKVFSIVLTDHFKDDAPDLIAYLKAHHIKPTIISGDHESFVSEAAEELGIESYYAEVKPQEKLEIIRNSSSDVVTGIIGDGINDAAAISAADAGMAFANASHMNIESADVVLLNQELNGIKVAFTSARLTYVTIRQNLFWAFSYNIIAVPLAIFGFVNPALAAAFMAFSDLFVIGNSIRLKWRLSRVNANKKTV